MLQKYFRFADYFENPGICSAYDGIISVFTEED